MCAVRAIDMEDFDPEDLVIHLCHRSGGSEAYGTPLKNGVDGERIINIFEELGTFIEGYIEYTRDEVMDRYDREPLFPTSSGRPATTTMRRDFYKMTRPCLYTNECPHDQEPSDYKATKNSNAAKCPSSVTPHPIRRGYITRLLKEGVSVKVVSDRCTVSPVVIDEHYDVRTEDEKMRQRQEVLREALE